MEYPLINNIFKVIVSKNLFQNKTIERCKILLDDNDKLKFNQYIKNCQIAGHSIEYLAECYNSFLKMTVKEMIYFRRNKHYRFKKYSEISDSVYNCSDYMQRYMYGLAISNFIWPNHILLRNFFLNMLPADRGGDLIEIGPGHGFYFYDSISRTKYTKFLGLDISQTSLKLTEELISTLKIQQDISVEFIQQDFLSFISSSSFDAVIMGEVLEHVETPLFFLNKIHEITKPDSFIFVSTCINAPEIDHIYLFRNEKEIRELFSLSKFEVVESIFLPYGETSPEDSVEQNLPINVGYVLKKVL